MIIHHFPRLLTTALTLTLLGVVGCSNPGTESVEATSVKPVGERNLAPDFELMDANGKTVKLSDYRGQVVLLNFWATWCGPCKLEIPWFVEFEQNHKNRGFSVLGVTMDEDGWDVVKPYLDRSRVNYRVLMGTDSVATLYGGVDSLPTTFLIDREGMIAAVHVGLVGKGDYENDIRALLEQTLDSRRAPDGDSLPAVVAGVR